MVGTCGACEEVAVILNLHAWTFMGTVHWTAVVEPDANDSWFTYKVSGTSEDPGTDRPEDLAWYVVDQVQQVLRYRSE